MAETQKIVAITGGTRGIGRSIADCFFERGWSVAVASRSSRESTLPRAIYHQSLDVRERAAMQQFVGAVRDRFGGLHAFVNCAGASRWREIAAIDEAFVAEVVETNVRGTLWGCQAAAAILPPDGAIVNVSSLAGKRGSTNNSAYCAAKFAVNGMTQSLAKELGPRGIRVNAVCPVYVETPYILQSLTERDAPPQGQSVSQYLTTFAHTQTALGRLPTAVEVAEVVYFLASPAASAITGQCINVDCGTLPQ